MGCATTTVEEHARNRVLPGLRLGQHWRFPRAAFVQAINTLAVNGDMHRTSAKRKAKAMAATDEKPAKRGSRRNPIPVLPTLQPTD